VSDDIAILEPGAPIREDKLRHLEDRTASITALRNDILHHLAAIGVLATGDAVREAVDSKDAIRTMHAHQRAKKALQVRRALRPHWDRLLGHLADGCEVDPARIDPELIPVLSDHETGELFRLATLLWSVPVSSGFGRRMRYLVRDRSNGKLIGVFALGDPVFNLRARDGWLGWTAEDRRQRLVHVLDAYVVGAVPPYAQLLGGKLVMALAGSAQVATDFAARYGETTGIISKEHKSAQLALITVTSALGRSSLYNRLRLTAPPENGEAPRILANLQRLGTTEGYGHFQLSDELFGRVRSLLAREEHPYASAHQFGQGPNWRFRVVRVGLKRLGLDPEILNHGIAREVYAMPLVGNPQEYFCGRDAAAHLVLPSVPDIAAAARQRWIVPRAERRPEFAAFRKDHLGCLAVDEIELRLAVQLPNP
jgi:hypothetical protein